MPRRATRETDARQEAAARRYAASKGLHLARAPGGAYSPIDYVARESDRYGSAVAEVLEVKCRSHASTTFQTVWLEESKASHLRRWGAMYDAAGVFVVEWGDGRLFWVNVHEAVAAAGEPVFRSREDRNDPRDRDLVYEVPLAAMHEVVDAPATIPRRDAR